MDIGQAIEEGGKRTVARNGLYFVAITWILSLLDQLFGNTVAQSFMNQVPTGAGPAGQFGQPAVGPSLGLNPAIASVLSFVLSLVGLVVVAAALRTFVTEDTETLPGERFTHNLLWVVVNLFVGLIVFWIAVAIGLVLLIVPGLFILVSLFFWEVYVAVEDQNFVEGFQNSWGLTGGNRIMLFVLGVLVVIIWAVIAGVFGVVGAVLPGVIGLAIAQIGSAFGGVFAIATAARTFLQLTEDGGAAA